MARGVSLTWAGGEHDFLLTIELLRALQSKCDAGPQWILTRLGTGNWYVDDVIQTIRLSLEGGGLDKETARKLVKAHVEDKPLTFSVMTAQAILVATLYGVEDDPVGEQTRGTDSPTETRSQEGSGNSATSTNGPESSIAT